MQGIDVAQGFEYLKNMARSACPTARTAIVFGSALAKMQAKREVMDDSMRIFDTEAEALAWLERVPALG
ncbi:MAG: hypothetical protein V4574_18395 [Pseudomonadota bacterium]